MSRPDPAVSNAHPPFNMDTFCPAPEDIMLPPSPPEPVEDQNSSTNSPRVSPEPVEPSDAADITAMSTTTTTNTANLPPPPTFHAPPRNRSPLSRTHLRSRSLAAPPTAPFMTRAHSSPGVDSRGRYAYPINQEHPGTINTQELPLRKSSPLSVPMEDTTGTIREHPELQSTPTSPRIHLDVSPVPQISSPGIHNTFPRSVRRRPPSPLNPSPAGFCGSNGPMTNHSSQPSSFTLSAKFNEPHPAYSFSSGSSMPSTPSSIRSRSPSISSLETIPDIPDAEAAATEADHIAKLKAAADKADADDRDRDDLNRRRSAMDMSSSPSPFGGTRSSLSWPDKRKRWSVCGAEGRHDLDLETIWED